MIERWARVVNPRVLGVDTLAARRGERKGYGGPRDVTSLSLSPRRPMRQCSATDAILIQVSDLLHTSKKSHVNK